MVGYLDEVLKVEGGDKIVHDPDDAGGLTKYGISQRAYPNLDIASLTADQAKAIYERDYVNAPGFNRVTFLPLQHQLVDFAVNVGPHTPVCYLQRLAGCVVDGILGARTAAAVNALDGRTLNNQVVALREQFYYLVAKAKPHNQKYLKGWLRRARGFYLPPCSTTPTSPTI